MSNSRVVRVGLDCAPAASPPAPAVPPPHTHARTHAARAQAHTHTHTLASTPWLGRDPPASWLVAASEVGAHWRCGCSRGCHGTGYHMAGLVASHHNRCMGGWVFIRGYRVHRLGCDIAFHSVQDIKAPPPPHSRRLRLLATSPDRIASRLPRSHRLPGALLRV